MHDDPAAEQTANTELVEELRRHVATTVGPICSST
ncbi:hypothetical protein [Saccharopolyspora pogona]